MDKTDVGPGEVYLARAQSEEYSDRVSVVRVEEVPDDNHPDVIATTLFRSFRPDRAPPEGGETSISPSMFETRLYEREDAE